MILMDGRKEIKDRENEINSKKTPTWTGQTPDTSQQKRNPTATGHSGHSTNGEWTESRHKREMEGCVDEQKK